METSRLGSIKKFSIEEILQPYPARINFNVAFVDGSYAMRVAKIQGTFPRHCHPNGDEGWFVYRGRMRIDAEIGTLELGPGEGTLIPKGVRHSTICLEEETMVLVINSRGFETVPDNPGELTTSGFSETDISTRTR